MKNILNDDFVNEIKDFCRGKENIQLSLGIANKEEEEMHLFNAQGESEFMEMSYEIGSITKVITGLLVAKAIKEHKLDLNDSISKYVDFINKDKEYPTIKSLVTHTSGCSDSFIKFDEERLKEAEKLNPFGNFKKEDVIEYFECQIYGMDNVNYEYSNLGSAIVGFAIENIYQRPYKKLVREFLDEICLENITTEVPRNMVSGYTDGIDCGHWIWSEDNPFNSVGCLYSDLNSMLKFGRKFYLDKDEIFERSITGIATILEVPKVEAGIFWGKYPELKIVTHSGSSGCFSSIIAIDHENERTIVMLANYLDEEDFGMAFRQLVRE